MTSDQCGCVKLVVGSWWLGRISSLLSFSLAFVYVPLLVLVLIPVLVLLLVSRLLSLNDAVIVLFLVALVLVLAAEQKFCPKERQGDKCKAKQLRRQVFIPFPIQTSLQVCLQERCFLQRPLSQLSPGLARGSS